jgi:hypothetical protein
LYYTMPLLLMLSLVSCGVLVKKLADYAYEIIQDLPPNDG